MNHLIIDEKLMFEDVPSILWVIGVILSLVVGSFSIVVYYFLKDMREEFKGRN